ncbi:hypothetical protein HTG_01110 [Natrinema mahii]|nr:hypothetical protein HTG_01110 [Natrinema mahii]
MSDDLPERNRGRSRGRRVRRWVGLFRIAIYRLVARLRHVPRQTIVTVALIAVTIALLMIVTGIAAGIATDSPADSEADVRIVPAGGGTLSSVIDVETARLGNVHETSATLDEREDVAYATPVLVEAVRIRVDGSDETETVLAMGVVPPAEPIAIEGVSTAPLEPGDPHFANGAYDGARTGEVVLTDDAAAAINASEGDSLEVGSSAAATRRRENTGGSLAYTATAIEDTAANGVSGALPIVMLHLSELQSISGADDDDLADQVLVKTGPDASTTAVESAAADAYPNATVQTGDDGQLASIRSNDFALATSLVALIVAVVICSLFVATSAALTIDKDRQTIAVFAAIGFSTRSRLAIVAVTTLSLTLAGALVGIVLGTIGISVTNYVATATVAPEPIATIRPAFGLYAVAVALIAGVLALPYPLSLVARTNVVTELGR